MDEETLLAMVNRWLHADEETLWRAVQSTLETLAERLDKNESRHLASELPERIAPFLFTGTPAEPFDVDDFVRRVAQREGVDVTTAESHARAVFAALREALPAKAYADMVAELPKDFAPLVQRDALIDASEFLDHVSRQAGLDRTGAERAIDAVLRTIAERVAPGEVDDLIARLPVELHPSLKQGKASADDRSRKMPAEALLARVAHREGVDAATAIEHVRAVMSTLRTAVGVDRYFDVTVELPPSLVTMLGVG